MILVGRVRSGTGDAARWLHRFRDAYSRKLGMPVFPGSLNLALPHAFDWHAADLQPRIIRFGREEYGGERDILLLPCRLQSLGGQRAFLWTTTTAAQDRDDPHVVEIVAPVGLRAAFGLHDGDEVTLELRDRDTTAVASETNQDMVQTAASKPLDCPPAMSQSQANSTRTTRMIRATPEAIYRAFLNPAMLVAWLPPAGMTAELHAFDARAGGGYEMSLFYLPEEPHFRGKTAEHEDRVAVRFVDLAPPHRIVEAVRFVSDDPAFGGEMRLTVTIEPHEEGCEVTLAFDDLPPGLRPEDNDAGARSSLAQLAQMVEA